MIHRFEHHSQPMLPMEKFLQRLLNHGLLAAGVLLIALGIGILGYHLTEGLPWLTRCSTPP